MKTTIESRLPSPVGEGQEGEANISSSPNKNLKWIYLVLLSLIWGSSFILMKRGLIYYSPEQVAAIRITVAFAASFPLAISGFRHIRKEDWKYIIVPGVVGSGIPALLFAIAQTHINSSLAGMLNSLTPLFTLLVGYLFFKYNFKINHVLGVILGFLGAAGLVLIRADGLYFDPDSSGAGFALLIVVATLLYGISVNTIKAKLGHINAITISGYGLLFAAIPYAIYLFFFSDFLTRLHTQPGAWTGFGYVSTLAIMSTATSNILYFHMVKISSPLFASAVTYFIPIIALGWGMMDGEQLQAAHIVAFAFILAGVSLISYRSSKG